MVLYNEMVEDGMNMENELLKNLNRLHTTKLGVERIKRNTALDTDDCIITVNAYSYTVITAHRKKQ